MSVETDVAEIKQDQKNFYRRFDEFIDHQKQICEMKHEPIGDHLKESMPYRDGINRMKGMMIVMLSVMSIILAGFSTMSFFTIRYIITERHAMAQLTKGEDHGIHQRLEREHSTGSQ